jgi:hypothetical protein
MRDKEESGSRSRVGKKNPVKAKKTGLKAGIAKSGSNIPARRLSKRPLTRLASKKKKAGIKRLHLRKSQYSKSKKRRLPKAAKIYANKKKPAIKVRAGSDKLIRGVAKPVHKARIVRIMGEGQFTVDSRTLKELSKIDNSIVQLVSRERSDDSEFKQRLRQLTAIVEKKGRPLDPKEIIQSDIILPSVDLSIDEAKKLFKGEGVIPEI